jgi:hypothetical protein
MVFLGIRGAVSNDYAVDNRKIGLNERPSEASIVEECLREAIKGSAAVEANDRDVWVTLLRICSSETR